MSERLGGFDPSMTEGKQDIQETVGPPLPDNPHNMNFGEGFEITVSSETPKKPKKIVVSNRLPFNAQRRNGSIDLTPSVGGMAIAMGQSLNAETKNPEDALWIGYLEVKGKEEINQEEEALETAFHSLTEEHKQPFKAKPLDIPDALYQRYYAGFSNGVLWPWFHEMGNRDIYLPRYDLASPSSEDEEINEQIKMVKNTNSQAVEHAWESYIEVNKMFAEKALSEAGPDTEIDVQDYQLMMVGKTLKEEGFTGKTKFFLHIPFPSPEQFAKVPHGEEISQALLTYDQVGFQTKKDRDNFLSYVQTHLGEKLDIDRQDSPDNHVLVTSDGVSTKVGAFPISIDSDAFEALANQESVKARAAEIRKEFKGKELFFSAGRSDYIKGFVESLAAYYTLLRESRDLRGKVAFVLAAAPSREKIPSYQKYNAQLVHWVDKINTVFPESAVTFINHDLPQEELAAYYMAANTLLASRGDGMNLMAKEQAVAAATVLDDDNIPEFIPMQILSKGAGSSEELTDAVLIEKGPFNKYNLAQAMLRVVKTPREDRIAAVESNVEKVRQNTIIKWGQDRAAA